MSEVRRLQERYLDSKKKIIAEECGADAGARLLKRHTELLDSVVQEIFEISSHHANKHQKASHQSSLAIVATGGYGRGELSPFSDVDISFVPSEEDDPWVEAMVHHAFMLVMDVFLSLREVQVGYSYRPVGEAPTWDLHTKTALLDARHVCGDERLTAALSARVRTVLSPLHLAFEKRHYYLGNERRGGNPLYLVEPHLKEGRGALRDLHRARWVFQLVLGTSHGELMQALENRGCVSGTEIAGIRAASDWFFMSRNWLHARTGKKTDILLNTLQDRIAGELGNCSARDWLMRHFEHAEVIERFLGSAEEYLLEGPLELSGFTLEGGRLRMAGEGRPETVINMVGMSQKYGIPMRHGDLARLKAGLGCPSDAGGVSAGEAHEFLALLKDPEIAAPSMRALAALGLMDRFVRDFSRLMRFVPDDPAHLFTVGEHSLRMLEWLELLTRGEDKASSRFTDLIRRCSHYDMLCLAALVHDAGKRQSGSDHSEASAAMAEDVAQVLRLPAEKKQLLVLLVRHHLLLARTSRLHDLNSAAVIQNVAEKVVTIDGLRHLYVFTYADSRAVAHGNWNSMDSRQLEELYLKVQDFISGPGPDADPAELENRLFGVRRKLLRVSSLDNEEAIRSHCDALPASYVLNTSLEEIACHMKLMERLEKEKVVLDTYNRPGDDYSELTVCAYDEPEPGMLAKITGVLYGLGVDIHRAQVFTLKSRRPVALDTLWVSASGVQLSDKKARRLQHDLSAVLRGDLSFDEFLNAVEGRPPPSIRHDSIDLRNDLSEDYTVVHVVARDLRGLLFHMTRVLSLCGLSIHTAKIATWGGRAENNFYVSLPRGERIPESDLHLWKSRISRRMSGISSEP